MRHNFLSVFTFLFLLISLDAQAITIDWNGFFRADYRLVHDYQHNLQEPGYSNSGFGGEYIRGQGKKSASFSTLFARLKPRILVSDNIIVRSEWNLGDPVLGFFGRNIPRYDQGNPQFTTRNGMELSVSRLWLDAHTDFGTLQIGRAPMQWGMGAVFHSGDGVWDRYQSTSDTVRLLSKFGRISFMPIYAKSSFGQSAGGALNPSTGAVLAGSDDITDYGIGLKYENTEEDLDAGVLYYKRNASDTQTTIFYPAAATPTYTGIANGMNLKLIDLYAKKSWHKFDLQVEVPIYNGQVGDVNNSGAASGLSSRNDYRATAVLAEVNYNGDYWKHTLKVGTVPGQENVPTGNRGKQFGALYLHRNFKLGHILFNYNLGGFGANNPDPIAPSNSATSTTSPFDTAITNAKYLMIGTERKGEQWTIGGGVVYAQANQVASAGKDYFNHRTRAYETGVAAQSDDMGFEADLSVKYAWDENITFGADLGMLFPGKYFSFINQVGLTGRTDAVTAFVLSAATTF